MDENNIEKLERSLDYFSDSESEEMNMWLSVDELSKLKKDFPWITFTPTDNPSVLPSRHYILRKN